MSDYDSWRIEALNDKISEIDQENDNLRIKIKELEQKNKELEKYKKLYDELERINKDQEKNINKLRINNGKIEQKFKKQYEDKEDIYCNAINRQNEIEKELEKYKKLYDDECLEKHNLQEEYDKLEDDRDYYEKESNDIIKILEEKLEKIESDSKKKCCKKCKIYYYGKVYDINGDENITEEYVEHYIFKDKIFADIHLTEIRNRLHGTINKRTNLKRNLHIKIEEIKLIT